MRHAPVELRALFGALLAVAATPSATGCRDPGPCTTPFEFHDVDPDLLAAALEDGYIERAECQVLCRDADADASGGGDSSATASDTAVTDTAATDTAATDTVATDTVATDTGDPSWDIYRCERIKGEPAAVRCHIHDCEYGRRPEGLLSTGCSRGDTPLGRFFAEAAHLEAASVIAFERLADALLRMGAPAELVHAALRAADDERSHAVAMSTLAGRHGGEASTPELAPSRSMTLLELAIDNAVQGCVAETWAALVAHHQAIAAADPTVAEIMARIADDETRHGELAWAIDAWVRSRLADVELRVIDEALAEAVDALARRVGGALAPDPSLGLPSGEVALALHDGLRRRLWAGTEAFA